MAVTSQAALIDALEAGDYDRILDTPECFWLELKRSAYGVESGNLLHLSAKGKYELCKDVTELANDRGGVLLIGVQERLSATSGQSIADKITPVKVSAVDLAHYKNCLLSNIYPMIPGITMTWYLVGEEKGLLAIVVPKRTGAFHIVKHTLDETGSTVHGMSIPIRADDQTYLMTPEHLYRLLEPKESVGILKNKRLSKSLPPEIFESMSRQLKKADDEGRRIRNVFISSLDWDELPVFILQAVPVSTRDRLEHFYDEVEEQFRNTKPLRTMGFNLNSFGHETLAEDGAYIKGGIRDASLRLDQNGMLTMAIKGNDNLLGWAVNKDKDSSERNIYINSIVLIEEVFEFTRFVSETLSKYGLSNWKYVVDIRRFKEYYLTLAPGGPHWVVSSERMIASKDSFKADISRSNSFERDAYKILEEFYALFMLPTSAIPYTANEKVTIENIKNLNINGY